MYWILFIGTALISWLVSATFNSRMKKYSQVPLNSDMTGADVARKMLRDNGIDDVEVVQSYQQDGKPQRLRIRIDLCGCRCRGCTRMRTRRTTRSSIRSAQNAFCPGTDSKLLFEICNVGITRGNAVTQSISATDVGRYRTVCHYNAIQFHYLTRRDRCFQKSFGVVAFGRRHRQSATTDGRICT